MLLFIDVPIIYPSKIYTILIYLVSLCKLTLQYTAFVEFVGMVDQTKVAHCRDLLYIKFVELLITDIMVRSATVEESAEIVRT